MSGWLISQGARCPLGGGEESAVPLGCVIDGPLVGPSTAPAQLVSCIENCMDNLSSFMPGPGALRRRRAKSSAGRERSKVR